MIAYRNFLRVDLAWKFTKIYVIPKHSQHFQRCFSSCGFNYNLGTHIEGALRVVMDRKKQKMVAKTWRPVSTQSRSIEEYSVKNIGSSVVLGDKKHDFGGQVQEIKCTVSSYESTVLAGDHEAEVVNDAVVTTRSPKAVQDSEGIDLEGQTAPSADDESLSAAQKHSVTVKAGASLMRFIRGKGGATQKTIEEEMGVKIILPLSRKEDCLIIEGNSAESVARASDKVKAVIDETVNRNLDYSHFVSLPLAVHPELVNKLINFQNSVLGITVVNQDENLECDSSGKTSDSEGEKQNLSEPRVAVELKAEDSDEHVKVDITNIPLVSYSPKVSKSSTSESKASTKLLDLGIEKSIFIKPKTFHLTVLMLKLWSKDRIEAATEVLRSVSPKVIDALENQPVLIRLKGLECMKGSPAKARVVYAPVEVIGGEDRLLHACQVINNAFTEAGLVLESDLNQKLKLHATIMNARHRKSKKGSRKSDSFDARTIFGQYGSEEWGEYLIREAHLSQRFVFDDNGYYHCCASIPFPEEMELD